MEKVSNLNDIKILLKNIVLIFCPTLIDYLESIYKAIDRNLVEIYIQKNNNNIDYIFIIRKYDFKISYTFINHNKMILSQISYNEYNIPGLNMKIILKKILEFDDNKYNTFALLYCIQKSLISEHKNNKHQSKKLKV